MLEELFRLMRTNCNQRQLRASAVVLLAAAACANSPRATPSATAQPQAPIAVTGAPAFVETALGQDLPITPNLKVKRIAPSVWVHVTLDEHGYPANGMLVETERGIVLVDTTWSADEASALLGFVDAQLKRPVTTAVITHFHGDRTGGLTVVLEQGIPVQSTARTAELLPPALATRVSAPDLAVGEVFKSSDGYELFYPGPGHSIDNVVVWFPTPQILFGGCLVKDKDASSLGNVADADLEAWPLAVRRVAARYPEARLVVPGHGNAADPQALAHTLDLLAASK